MLEAGCPAGEIGHVFMGSDDDEYIVWGRTGFHITIDWDQDGRVTCEAEPGEFVETNGGAIPMWIKRLTSFHKTWGNQATH